MANQIKIQALASIALGTKVTKDGKDYEVIENNIITEVTLKEVEPTD